MIVRENNLRQLILSGAEELYDAVKTTLGPKGRNVLIKDKFGSFNITHDGVTVAKAIKTNDEPETKLGIDLLKEASKKMDQVGDGTTSVTVLAYHLMVEANKLIDQGHNPMMVKKQLEAEVDGIIEQIQRRSVTIGKNPEDVLSVAKISAGDEKLGKIIADMMVEVGYDGGITVETTQGMEIETDVAEGYSFDNGYLSPYFITDNASRECVLVNPAVVVVNGPLNDLRDFQQLIDPLLEGGVKSFLIIAENVSSEALNNLIINKVNGVFKAVAVKAPGFGDNRTETLNDIGAYTGAATIDSMSGKDLADMTAAWAGTADKVIVRENQTVIVGASGHKDDIDGRVKTMKAQLKKADDVQTANLNQRIAAITGNIATIKVGGVTEQQANETKYRVDDAIAAVRAAMKDGIVPGGGTTLWEIGCELAERGEDLHTAVANALVAPRNTLLRNSGYEPSGFDTMKNGEGVDVTTGKIVNMQESGIIDPTKVTVEVVRNAFAVAAIAITVGAAIVDPPISQEELSRLMKG